MRHPHPRLPVIAALACFAVLGAWSARAAALDDPVAYYAHWSKGVPADPGFFPIAVWLQSPPNAAGYKAAGVNLFIGLWDGATDTALSQLAAAGMKVLCDQDTTKLGSSTIAGWTQMDEPDNAQPDGAGGYGPPITPAAIVATYGTIVGHDPNRPVFLSFGQGVSYTTWIGRGTRTGHTEDYAQYSQGGDILSFDIYPVNSPDATVTGKLEYVAKGVDNLRSWSGDTKPVWCWIECTRIGTDSPAKPTPAQVRSEVWMALVHGAKGIGYFCHSWNPSFDEAALLHDATMLAAVKAINQQIATLAPVLNSPQGVAGASASSSNAVVPVDLLAKQQGGSTWLFAVAMRPGSTTATFTVPAGAIPAGAATVEVIGEGRTLPLSGGTFSDAFSAYGVHLYKLAGSGGSPVAPTITTQPHSVTVTAGATATFTVAATGTPTPGYQWQKNGSAIPGATAASYTTPATVAGDNGATYRVVVSNSAGSVTSSPATLTVTAATVAPAITTQPHSVTVAAGATATFTVAATGTPAPGYQWQKNGSAIPGATAASYTTPATAAGDNGATYRVVVSNSAGSVTSSPATLTVTAAGGAGGGGSGDSGGGGKHCGMGGGIATLGLVLAWLTVTGLIALRRHKS